MKDLFSRLGEIAQTAAGTAFPGVAPSATASSDRPAQGGQSTPGSAFGSGNLLGALKDSVPGGVGGLLGAGALGGILGALLSGGGVGKTVRKLGEGALVVGGTAAAAGLAWKLYQKWSQSNAGTSAQTSDGTPAVTGAPASSGVLCVRAEADPVAMLVLEAMVFAARADGHMDTTERDAVHTTMGHLFPGTDVAASLDSMLNKPLDPEGLARRVQNPEQALDLYRLSRMVIVVDHTMERAYLDALAAALNISKDTQAELDKEVAALQGGASAV